jgi:hypothetical protein
MKILEFEGTVGADQRLVVPESIVAQIGVETPVKVVLLLDDEEDRDWARLSAEQFFRGYSDADAIYELDGAG